MSLSSTYVEIAIGLSTLFALLSLVASLAAELVARALSMRARMLEEAIRGLVGDGDMARRIYRHALVQGLSRAKRSARYIDVLRRGYDRVRRLFQGQKARPVDGLDDWLLRRVELLQKPSYISSKIFADVLLDLVRPSRQLRGEVMRLGLTALLPSEEEIADGKEVDRDALQKGLVNAVKGDDEQARLRALLAATTFDLDDAPPLGQQVAAGIPLLRSLPLRQALGTLFLSRALARRAREGKATPPEVDIATAHAALAAWFDDAMDRATGWYKRRIQLVVIGIAALIVAALNVDAFYMADRIARDEAVRAAIVGDAAALRAEAPKVPIDDTDTSETLATRVAELSVEISKLSLPIGWPARDEVDEVEADVASAKTALAEATEEQEKAAKAAADATLAYERASAEAARARSSARTQLIAWKQAALAELGVVGQEALRGELRYNLAVAEDLAASAIAVEAKEAAMTAGAAAEAAQRKLDAAQSTYDDNRAKLRDLRIRRLEPLAPDVDVVGAGGWTWLDRNEPLGLRLIGWLVSALAASLGAQFWFDALGKLVTLRSSGKKPERGG